MTLLSHCGSFILWRLIRFTFLYLNTELGEYTYLWCAQLPSIQIYKNCSFCFHHHTTHWITLHLWTITIHFLFFTRSRNTILWTHYLQASGGPCSRPMGIWSFGSQWVSKDQHVSRLTLAPWRGFSRASFLAAASMALAALRSSFSAITLGSSGLTQSEPNHQSSR